MTGEGGAGEGIKAHSCPLLFFCVSAEGVLPYSTVTTGWRRVDYCVGLTALLGLRVVGSGGPVSLPLPLAVEFDGSIGRPIGQILSRAHNRVALPLEPAPALPRQLRPLSFTRWHCNLFLFLILPAYNIVPPRQRQKRINTKQPRKSVIMSSKKATRDPNAPKRNQSAYLLYQNGMRDTFKLQNPGMVSRSF